jgi:hypothetical protein
LEKTPELARGGGRHPGLQRPIHRKNCVVEAPGISLGPPERIAIVTPAAGRKEKGRERKSPQISI